jgi:hypothetical protein
MTVTAKPVLKNKFWIVENEGVRVGTLSKEDDGFVMSSKSSVEIFKSENALKKKFGKDFLIAKIKNNNATQNLKEVHGYPTRTKPFNSMFDIQQKLPLFTKSEKSKSIYCAGYYLVKFNVNWLKSFCPKLITIERNEFMGPFKTEFEMKAALSNVNRAN